MLKLKLREEKPKNRLKLSLGNRKANPVRLRLRTGKPTADGFDIEAPDREEDPTVEEAIVLRMLPDTPGLAAMQRAVEANDFSGIEVRFEDRRHALVTCGGETYHAQLMDLPTITEVHKTVDRRNIFKTVDLSQVLLVTHRDGEPKPSMTALTRFTEDAASFPHGLTPPMYNVRNRRFPAHMSTRAIETMEAQVDELLRRDAEAKDVAVELLPASAVAAKEALAEATTRAAAAAAAAQDDESDMDVDGLDEELERMMSDDEDEDDEDDDGTGAARGSAKVSDDDDDEDDVDDDDDDDDDEGGDRGDAGGEDDDARQHAKQLREEIRELEVTIAAKTELASTVVNEIMRARHMDAVARLKLELEKKMALLPETAVSAAEDDEDDEDEDEEDDDDDEPDLGELPEASASAMAANERRSERLSSERLGSEPKEDDEEMADANANFDVDVLDFDADDMHFRDQLRGQLGSQSPQDDLDDLF